jgi:hypothetical protein
LSVVYHVGAGTLPRGNNLKTFLNFRNNLVMLAKNLSHVEAVRIIVARILMDHIAAWKALLQGNAGFFAAVVKAHLYFLKWLLADKGKVVFPISRKGSPAGWYRGSVVWQHFIKKKNVFSDIVGNK